MIYIDNGKTVKVYSVSSKIAKAIETLLEADESLMYSETDTGYTVELVEKEE